MDSSYESMMHNTQSKLAAATARIAALEAELAKERERSATLFALVNVQEIEIEQFRAAIRDALPHLHHTGATHHEQCACSVKRRIEAMVKP